MKLNKEQKSKIKVALAWYRMKLAFINTEKEKLNNQHDKAAKDTIKMLEDIL